MNSSDPAGGSGVLVMEPASERDRYASMYLSRIFRRVNSACPKPIIPACENVVIPSNRGEDGNR